MARRSCSSLISAGLRSLSRMLMRAGKSIRFDTSRSFRCGFLPADHGAKIFRGVDAFLFGVGQKVVHQLQEIGLCSNGLILRRSLLDRKSVVWGKSVSVRVDIGGRRIIKKNTKQK